MESSAQILTDLKAVLSENHRDFSFLIMYKGVPLICRAQLNQVINTQALFTVQPPESAVLCLEDSTLVLSDGLLEPLEATLVCNNLVTGEFSLSGFSYAGSKFANRRELRVEPAQALDIEVRADGRSFPGKLADLSVRGLGVNLEINNVTTIFIQGKNVSVYVALPTGTILMEGKVRSAIRSRSETLRLAVEFIGSVPEKATIIRYVMQRRSEIVAEVRALYEKAIKSEQ